MAAAAVLVLVVATVARRSMLGRRVLLVRAIRAERRAAPDADRRARA